MCLAKTLTLSFSAIIAFSACGAPLHPAKASSDRVREKSPTTDPKPPLSGVDEPIDGHLRNADFEDVGEGAVPVGWALRRPGFILTSDEKVTRRGTRSLKLEAAGGAASAAALQSLAPEQLRDRLVTVRGWFKRSNATKGWAGFWVKVANADGDPIRDERSNQEGVTGNQDWTLVTISVAVPADADSITLGLVLSGDGTTWVDDVRVDVAPLQKQVVATGRVVGAQGESIAGADVSAIRAESVVRHTTTGADGSFSLALPSPGSYSFTAAGPEKYVGALLDERLLLTDTSGLEITLKEGEGRHLHGTVTADFPLPADTHVVIGMLDGDGVFSVPLTPGGDWMLNAPVSKLGYWAEVDVPESISWTQGHAEATDDLPVHVERSRAPSAELMAWLREHVTQLKTVDPSAPLDDLNSFSSLVGDARVVAVGEATHGSREFFQLKHRILRYLVEAKGFNIFAIEASSAEAHAVEAYVQTGSGSAREVLAGLGFWTWNTEEVLALIEWMRSWNATHEQKVHFVGIDMQSGAQAYSEFSDLLRRVSYENADQIIEALSPLTGYRGAGAHSHDAKDAERIRKAINDVRSALLKRRVKWREAIGEEGYGELEYSLRLLEQAFELDVALGTQAPGADLLRDRFMAENAERYLKMFGAKARMFVWAHNGHIAFGDVIGTSVGAELKKHWGAGFLSIGLAFGSGAFQALDSDFGTGPRKFVLPPVTNTNVCAPFWQMGDPILALDLRKLRGAALQWFGSPHTLYTAGAFYSDADETTWPVTASKRFDALIYLRETTRARPLRSN